jgi:hypothetical protein
MKNNYDPNQPIEAFIDQIKDVIALADAANTPYTPEQIVAISYNLLFSRGACFRMPAVTRADDPPTKKRG